MSRRSDPGSRNHVRQSRPDGNSEHLSSPTRLGSPGRVPRYRMARDAHESVPYEVGYAKPPTRTQFKRGQSGNPRGRPKHSRNFRTIIEGALTAPISVREGEKQRKVTKLEAIFLQTSIKALKGDHRAAQTLLKFAAQAGLVSPIQQAVPESPQLTPAEQAILDEVKALLPGGRGKRR
jgi:hypothetical protein